MQTTASTRFDRSVRTGTAPSIRDDAGCRR
jgi:hypothetical protein